MTQAWVWAAWALALWEATHRFRLVRRLVREVLAAVTRLDLTAVALVRRLKPPRYALEGACQRRGDCCSQIVASPPRAMLRRPRVLALFVAMHRWAHNFHLRGRGPDGQLIFRCGYLQTDGKCGIYRFRPRLCRTYPVLPFFAPPKVLPGCGYRVKLRGMGHHRRLPIVEAHVGMHHPTPPRRPNATALEHEEDFRLVHVGARPASAPE